MEPPEDWADLPADEQKRGVKAYERYKARCPWRSVDGYNCEGPRGHEGHHSVYPEYWKAKAPP